MDSRLMLYSGLPPQSTGLVDLQDFRGGPVEVGHPLVLVDGQQPLFQGVQNVHPLEEEAAEGVRLVPQQVVLDLSGQAEAEKAPRRPGGHPGQQVEEDHPHHGGPDGTDVDPRHGVADEGAVVGVNGGVGAAVRPGGGFAVVDQCGVAGQEPIHDVLAEGGQGGGVILAGGQVVEGDGGSLPVVDGEHVDAGDVLDRPPDVLGGLRCVEILGEQGHVGRHLGGTLQGLVPGAVLRHEVEQKAGHQREQQGDDDAQQQDVAYLVVDRRAGVRMVLHEDPNLATWILPVVYHIFQGASMNDRESEGKNNGKNRKTFNSMEVFV